MQLWRLTLKELLHRKVSFVSGLISVAIAVACVSSALTLLAAHDLRTEAVITQKEADTRESMRQMEDDYRRIMRDMGYNVLILHQDQDFAKLQREGVPDTFMPDDYAQRLAQGGITTLNHLLPVLQQRTRWEERDMEVVIAGVLGQPPIQGRRSVEGVGVGPDGTPIMTPVPRDGVDVGHALAERFGLSPGDALSLNGNTLTVNKCLPRRGAQEDITLWVHLDQAQEWFGMPGKINGIFALECVCHAESLGKIIEEVHGILPETQVFEFSSLVQSRALARARAAETHRDAIEAERRNRAALRHEREQMALVLTPMAAVGAAVWIFLLTMTNVRERRYEIGILRALGFSALKIIGLFQLRVLAMSLIGALFGYLAGVLAGILLGGAPVSSPLFAAALHPLYFLAAMIAAAMLAGVAAWIPALRAAAQDPAEILKEMT